MPRKGKQQLELFKQDTAPTIREDGVPVYRVCLMREGRVPYYNQQIRSAVDASTLLHTYLADVDREHFVIILLNQKNRVNGVNTVSIGSLTASVVHPREVFNPTTPLYLALCLSSLAMAKIGPVITLLHPCDQR